MRPLWERAPQLAGKVHDKQHASQTTTALGASMVCPASHVATNRSRNIDAAQHKEQHSTCLQFVLDATKRNVHQETKVPRRRWAAENTQPCVLYGNVHPNLQGKCTTSSTHHKTTTALGASMVCPASHVATNRGRNRCSATQGAALDLSAVRFGRHQAECTPGNQGAPEKVGC